MGVHLCHKSEESMHDTVLCAFHVRTCVPIKYCAANVHAFNIVEAYTPNKVVFVMIDYEPNYYINFVG